jgi:hypothetical protein
MSRDISESPERESNPRPFQYECPRVTPTDHQSAMSPVLRLGRTICGFGGGADASSNERLERWLDITGDDGGQPVDRDPGLTKSRGKWESWR